jgi:DNA polymerase
LTYSDYSQIEARVLPWLANSPEAEKTLDIFREGRDLYSENAVNMFGLSSIDEVTKDLRQSAKVAVLACGFAGGYNALLSMAKIYGMQMSEDTARTNVARWRQANKWAEPLWYGLKDAGGNAVKFPNKVFSHGRISFMYDGKDWLWLQLPSGRCLAYFQPRFELVEYPWGDSGVELTFLWGSGKPKAGEKWPRTTVSPITFVQHATQATAADVMRETLTRADKAGLRNLFSVHDEMIIEGDYFDELHAIMEVPPTWADGLPIAADTQTSVRYGK